MTVLNYWHYIFLTIVLLIFIAGVITSLRQKDKKLVMPMLLSVSLVTVLLAPLTIIVTDKYTKVVKLYKMKNKRLINIEKIVYTGIVKNEGKHKIGKVTFQIKIVSGAHVIGAFKGDSFYKPSSFLDIFGGGLNMKSKPQTLTKEFVVARNLKPGTAKAFRVHFDYPPYFRDVSHFAEVWGH